MARSLSAEITAQLTAENYFPAWLFEFEDSDSNMWRYTDLDVPLYASDPSGPNGTYEPLGFEFDSIEYTLSNVMDSCEIRIENRDSALSSIFLDTGVHRQEASIYLALLNVSGGIIDTLQVFTGEIDGFELKESSVKLTIGSVFSNWSNESYAKHSSSCRWKVFKGTECGYSGSETWCDRSYRRCLALGNIANYGGFRFLPDLERKTIWWGPNADEQRANERARLGV